MERIASGRPALSVAGPRRAPAEEEVVDEEENVGGSPPPIAVGVRGARRGGALSAEEEAGGEGDGIGDVELAVAIGIPAKALLREGQRPELPSVKPIVG